MMEYTDYRVPEKLMIENYNNAKKEILTTIDIQYRLLSLLITATAAVFVYILDSQKNSIRSFVLVTTLIIPGLYAFFGVLWLDQVYRQRRLGAFIYTIEAKLLKIGYPGSINELGWEHFVQAGKNNSVDQTDSSQHQFNKTSRMYYRVCLGLFFAFPAVTYALTCFFRSGAIEQILNGLLLPAVIGVLLYVSFLIISLIYIKAIMSLVDSFENENNTGSNNSGKGVPNESSENSEVKTSAYAM